MRANALILHVMWTWLITRFHGTQRWIVRMAILAICLILGLVVFFSLFVKILML